MAGEKSNWTVRLIDQAEREMRAQPKSIRAKFDRVIALIETNGLYKIPQHYLKQLRGKIWEIRVMGKDTIARAAYLTVTGNRVMILHVFTKKDPKTLARYIKTAQQRAKEVSNDY